MKINKKLLEKLSTANHVAALTGAGISAESGIKTFRDSDGLWTKFNPMELATVDGFMNNTELVWEWYKHRKETIGSKKPNPGHIALAKMEQLFTEFTLITQNIDRLHHRAGSKNIYELHGNVEDNYCFDCKEPFYGDTNLPEGQIPICPECGGKIRPAVVWFGEMLPVHAIRGGQEAAARCDVFFSIGTSAEVYPAANIPLIAKQAGAYVVEVNPKPTAISTYMDECLLAPSGEALPLLLDEFEKFKNEQEKV